MLTDKEKQELVAEIITESVPEIVKAVKEELAKGNAAGKKENDAAVNYAELVKSAMK